MRWILVAALLAGPIQEDPLEATARRVAALIADEPAGLAELFDPGFLSKVPEPMVKQICRRTFQDHGAVKACVPLSREAATSGKFTFTLADGGRMTVSLVITSGDPPRVAGLRFLPVVAPLKSLDEVAASMRKLPGRVSFQVVRLGDEPKTLAALEPDAPLAIGSAFKLLILAALVEDRRPWTDVVRLQPGLKSFPSGELHTWPDDSPLTVHTLASLMISKSDNTATDHLLHHAGRSRVEEIQKELGIREPARNVPMAGTRELFQLKSDAALRGRYLAADAAARRRMLDGEIRALPRDRVASYGSPTAVDTVEWFASAADLCRVMDWFHRKGDSMSLGVLALNPGLEIPPDRFTYGGFKGGSEPGVLNLTFLLRRKDGAAVALSAGWNRTDVGVDEQAFISLVQSAIHLAGEP